MKPARIGIYERGMWVHKNNAAHLDRLEELRRKMDCDAQAEAPLYGLGPLRFFDEIATMEVDGMPDFFALLRRYKGAIISPRYHGQVVIIEPHAAVALDSGQPVDRDDTANPGLESTGK